MALLFVVTAAIRLGLLLPWIQDNPGEVWDAYGYYVRGGSLRDALVGLLHGQVPERAQFWTVYRGLGPPLQTLILAGVFLPFGTSIATGQIAMIVIRPVRRSARLPAWMRLPRMPVRRYKKPGTRFSSGF